MLAVAAAVAGMAGCSPQPARPGAGGGEVVDHYIVTCPAVIEFTNARGVQRRLSLVYSRDVPLIGQRDLTVVKASLAGRVEHLWLHAYIRHAALAHANGEPLGPFLRVVSDEPAAVRGQGPWFFAGAQGIFWCPDSLAVNAFGTVLVYDSPPPADGVWIPLTPQSYQSWYSQLDELAHLTRRFGQADEAVRTGHQDFRRPGAAKESP